MRKAVFCCLMILFCFGALVAAQDAVLGTAENDTLGTILVDANGMTVYTFASDTPGSGTSDCTGACLESWPAVTVASPDAAVAPPGAQGEIGAFLRPDIGAYQLTWNGAPLYRFSGDTQPGDVRGHEIGGVWFAVPVTVVQAPPEPTPAPAATPADTGPAPADGPTFLQVLPHPDYGPILANADGFVVYTFDNDEPGQSFCVGQCLELWPPVLVDSAQPPLPPLPGVTFGTLARPEEGALQLTYNELPLYYYVADEAPGEANGEGVGEVWHVVYAGAIDVRVDEVLGPHYVDPSGMTLYVFDNDEPNWSNCLRECAATWPPYAVDNPDVTLLAPNPDDVLATSLRPDGSYHIVLNERPLYRYSGDTQPGEANGDGIGGVWHIVPAEMPAGSTRDLPACTVTPLYNAVNLRQSASTSSPVGGNLGISEVVAATGQAVGGDGFVWWQLESGLFVREDVVVEEGECGALPTVEPPPFTAPQPQPPPDPDPEPPPPSATEEPESEPPASEPPPPSTTEEP